MLPITVITAVTIKENRHRRETICLEKRAAETATKTQS